MVVVVVVVEVGTQRRPSTTAVSMEVPPRPWLAELAKPCASAKASCEVEGEEGVVVVVVVVSAAPVAAAAAGAVPEALADDAAVALEVAPGPTP